MNNILIFIKNFISKNKYALIISVVLVILAVIIFISIFFPNMVQSEFPNKIQSEFPNKVQSEFPNRVQSDYPSSTSKITPNTVEVFARQFIDKEIYHLEKAFLSRCIDGKWVDPVPEYKIIDKKITKLEKIEEYNDYNNFTIEVWALEYLLLPDDIDKVVWAGGNRRKNGWITQISSLGNPYLVIKNQNGILSFLGATYDKTFHDGGLRQGVDEVLLDSNIILASKTVSEIQLRTFYQKKVVNSVIIPRSNSKAIYDIVDTLNSSTPTKIKSTNDFPYCDRFIVIKMMPDDRIIYLYKKDGVYYAEMPYIITKTLTEESFNKIRSYLGDAIPSPEKADKTQFIKPINDMLERYRAGDVPQNYYEYKFGPSLTGLELPTVDSTDDFILTEGNFQCQYCVSIPFGKDKKYEIKMQLNKQSIGEEKSQWNVTGVYYSEAKSENMKTWIFDLAMKNRFDFVPYFEMGNAPSQSPPYIFYAFILDFKNWDQDRRYLKKEYVEKVIKSHFEVENIIHKSFDKEWNYEGDLYRLTRVGSVRTEPIYNLKDYKTYAKDGKQIYEVVLEEYIFNEFGYTSPFDFKIPVDQRVSQLSKPMQYVLEKKGEKIKKGQLKVWEAIREMIAEGDTENFIVNSTEQFKFYFYFKTNNIVFIEHKVVK